MARTKYAAQLHNLCAMLNAFNSDYTRYAGSMVMCSKEKEDEIEAVIDSIESCLEKLDGITDREIAEFCDDVQGYRAFLDNVRETAALNREEIAKARTFLERYHAT